MSRRDAIYTAGYRKLDDAPRRAHPALAIARTALALAWRRRAVKLSLLPSAGAFMVCVSVLVGLVVLKRATEALDNAMLSQMTAQIVGDARDVLGGFVQFSFYASAFVLSMMGGALIADDLKANALDLYFARPLRRADYLLGKGLAALSVPVATLLVPTVLLWLITAGIADEALRGPLVSLLLPALVPALLATVALTGLMLGVSALSDRGASASVTFIGALIAADTLGAGLSLAEYEWVGYLSPLLDLRTVGEAIEPSGTGLVAQALKGTARMTNGSAWLSALALLALGTGGALIAFRRVARQVRG